MGAQGLVGRAAMTTQRARERSRQDLDDATQLFQWAELLTETQQRSQKAPCFRSMNSGQEQPCRHRNMDPTTSHRISKPASIPSPLSDDRMTRASPPPLPYERHAPGGRAIPASDTQDPAPARTFLPWRRAPGRGEARAREQCACLHLVTLASQRHGGTASRTVATRLFCRRRNGGAFGRFGRQTAFRRG